MPKKHQRQSQSAASCRKSRCSFGLAVAIYLGGVDFFSIDCSWFRSWVCLMLSRRWQVARFLVSSESGKKDLRGKKFLRSTFLENVYIKYTVGGATSTINLVRGRPRITVEFRVFVGEYGPFARVRKNRGSSPKFVLTKCCDRIFVEFPHDRDRRRRSTKSSSSIRAWLKYGTTRILGLLLLSSCAQRTVRPSPPSSSHSFESSVTQLKVRHEAHRESGPGTP